MFDHDLDSFHQSVCFVLSSVKFGPAYANVQKESLQMGHEKRFAVYGAIICIKF